MSNTSSPPLQVTCHGAAREVTGSCHLIEACGKRILFDCGMHQGGRQADQLNRRSFPFKARSLDAVVLSHGHIDHTGLLPRLAAQGYGGPIYATPQTIALAEILLRDSAHLQEQDAQRDARHRSENQQKNQNHHHNNRNHNDEPYEPLYLPDDVPAVLDLMRPVAYKQDQNLSEDIVFRFHDAGHILGSAITEFELGMGGFMHRLVMSGDLGPHGQALLHDPETLEHAHTVLMESTYGDRDHKSREATIRELEETLQSARRTGGHAIIPAFAVGRTQSLIYRLAEMRREGKLAYADVYIDSPMAATTTDLYCRNTQLFDHETFKAIDDHFDLCNMPWVHFTRSTEESKQLNELSRPSIIISASGMCNGGRILHHLQHNLWKPEAHVVIVGYQGRGTLGRELVDGAKDVKIFGEKIPVRAHIHTIGGLSAHAGASELLAWHSAFVNSNPQTILVHGEPEPMDALAERINRKRNKKPVCPELDQTVLLSRS